MLPSSDSETPVKLPFWKSSKVASVQNCVPTAQAGSAHSKSRTVVQASLAVVGGSFDSRIRRLLIAFGKFSVSFPNTAERANSGGGVLHPRATTPFCMASRRAIFAGAAQAVLLPPTQFSTLTLRTLYPETTPGAG